MGVMIIAILEYSKAKVIISKILIPYQPDFACYAGGTELNADNFHL
jgi:hypothetical protein